LDALLEYLKNFLSAPNETQRQEKNRNPFEIHHYPPARFETFQPLRMAKTFLVMGFIGKVEETSRDRTPARGFEVLVGFE
jgi:hypothetical protein